MIISCMTSLVSNRARSRTRTILLFLSRHRALNARPLACPVELGLGNIWMHATSLAGVERDSASLVPGDIVNLVDPPLSILPADMFLLSGDAIVNESMLTGESVPVGKIPVKDADLARFKDDKDISAAGRKRLAINDIGSAVVDGSEGLSANGKYWGSSGKDAVRSRYSRSRSCS